MLCTGMGRAKQTIAGSLDDRRSIAAVLCARRWGDSPLRFVQTLLFLNYTAETRQLDFIDYSHDKVHGDIMTLLCMQGDLAMMRMSKNAPTAMPFPVSGS